MNQLTTKLKIEILAFPETYNKIPSNSQKELEGIFYQVMLFASVVIVIPFILTSSILTPVPVVVLPATVMYPYFYFVRFIREIDR